MLPTQQKALSVAEKGAPFALITRAVPSPGPGYVLVKIHAAALNIVDIAVQRTGMAVQEWPIVLGRDAAGTVKALGEGVTDLQVGDKVSYQTMWLSDHGAFQQYGLAEGTRIAKIPDNISFDQAATFPLSLATAGNGFYAKAAAPRGGAELVAPCGPAIITGGASSVGQFAIQLAKLSGFSPIITTASTHNAEYCKAAGATHVIDYHTVPYADLPQAVAQITQEPVTFVYDVIASEASQRASWQILAPKGHLVVTHDPVVGAEQEDGKRLALVWGSVHSPEYQELGLAMYRALTGLIAEGAMKPNVVEVVPGGLAGVPDGLERLLAKKVNAVKLVVHPQETA